MQVNVRLFIEKNGEKARIYLLHKRDHNNLYVFSKSYKYEHNICRFLNLFAIEITTFMCYIVV